MSLFKTKNHPQSKKRKVVCESEIAATIPVSESSVKLPIRSCRVVGSLKSKIGLLIKNPNDFDPESYMDSSIGDSLDLVPIAAFRGHGKRKGLYGAFLLACYDADKKEYQSICKIGTGFSVAGLQKISSRLCSKEIATPKKCYRVDKRLKPSVWFEPTQVWEVKAADLTISRLHRAAIGIVEPYKGISLRFPRMVRVREDKKPEEATSSKQIAEMYLAQKLSQPRNQTKGD